MKAIQSHRWNPINYALLKDSDILRTKSKVINVTMAASETTSSNCFVNVKENNTNDDIDNLLKKDLTLNIS